MRSKNMRRLHILLVLLIIACSGENRTTTSTQSETEGTKPAAAIPVSNDPISIAEPTDGASVPHRAIVRGRTKDRKAIVWVVVRPMAGADYWVQPRVDVESDGAWSVQVYIGQDEDMNRGEHFKVMAVANPVNELHEGDILKQWPDAQWRSRMIEVVKK